MTNDNEINSEHESDVPVSQRESEMTAIWTPGWYELDQSLVLGVRQKYWFFESPPSEFDEAVEEFDLVFYNQLASLANFQVRYASILEMSHPHFGQLLRVDTDGLDYIFVPVMGEEIVVDAEENIGKAQISDFQVDDWSIHVSLVEVSDPVTG